MKQAIRKIDKAIQDLYNLEGGYRATDFLLKPRSEKSPTPHPSGSLLLQNDGEESFNVGIYFNNEAKKTLDEFQNWNPGEWTQRQLSAFSVATEEVSHFRYWLFHSHSGRDLSEFEMELQGEVDKFIITLFANPSFEKKNIGALFEQIFVKYSVSEELDEEQIERYLQANAYAMTFIQSILPMVENSENEAVLQTLRKFYRLGVSDKVSWIHSKR